MNEGQLIYINKSSVASLHNSANLKIESKKDKDNGKGNASDS